MSSPDLWEELARLNNELATAHRQLAKSNAELRWLNERKNELLGMAAHDLRNPLAAVLSYARFVAADGERLSEEQSRMIDRIRVNAERMLSIVDDVLDFAAIESGTVRLEPALFAVQELFDESRESVAPLAARKDVRIVVSVEPGVPEIRADRRKIAQVLVNLLSNAIKFSPAGSTVSVAATRAADGGVLLSVTDRGAGMSPAQVSRLFQPFVPVGSEPTAGEKGTGLGLAIVRRIVEAHGGRVEVESTPGEGTTFRVVLGEGGGPTGR